MDFKRTVHAAVKRWKEKQCAATDKAGTKSVDPQRQPENTQTETTEQLTPTESAPQRKETAAPAVTLEDHISAFLHLRYELRFNLLTETTEFRNKTESGAFRPLSERDLNAICVEAHREGIPCRDRDLGRVINSARVKAVHPVLYEYLHFHARTEAAEHFFRDPHSGLHAPFLNERRGCSHDNRRNTAKHSVASTAYVPAKNESIKRAFNSSTDNIFTIFAIICRQNTT